jgi:hypothetical protein
MSASVQDPRSFWLEARSQVVCAYCGKPRSFHAHHAVDRCTLRIYGVTGVAEFDTRNALRLCDDLMDGIEGRCHLQFENRRIAISTSMLKDCNIEYAFEIMGAAAYDYLHREYANADLDPRVELQLAV